MLKIGPENIMFLNSTEFFSDNDEDNILNINSFKFDLAKEEIKDIFKYSIKNENNNINLCNGLKYFHCNFKRLEIMKKHLLKLYKDNIFRTLFFKKIKKFI